ncbi:hypothetical protein [Qaidamihabitans albus]|uniref:hypothetical protein n=1 Tax=Qaidamihabitans albus TaxID=2795733 RepID=UPI0018F17077|nr:hypothetical protein [Qaidamihabitans albus]
MRVALPALLGVVLLGLLTGCGGEDLAKANYQRTTVTAAPGSGGQGEVPTGPIDDPAVAASALRTVDPCPLLDGAAGELGQAGQPEAVEWGACRIEVRDAGGKAINLVLDLGESAVLPDQATGNVEGLPLIEKETDEATCFVTAVTARDPSLGIAVQADYRGGDPCGPGYTVLQQVIRELHAEPVTYAEEPGSLLGVDPCASVDDPVLATVLGEQELRKRPMGLHTCEFDVDERPSVNVRFRVGYPVEPDQGSPVDLGDGVTAVQRKGTTDTVECEVSWQHRPLVDGDEAELVSASFSFASEDGDGDDACGKAAEVARNIAAGLPSP